jgi:hypothetical protein
MIGLQSVFELEGGELKVSVPNSPEMTVPLTVNAPEIGAIARGR